MLHFIKSPQNPLCWVSLVQPSSWSSLTIFTHQNTVLPRSGHRPMPIYLIDHYNISVYYYRQFSEGS